MLRFRYRRAILFTVGALVLGCVLLGTFPAFVAVAPWRQATPQAATPQATPPSVTPTTTLVDFNRDVLPILSGKCFACHGPDGSTRKGKLRLDRRDTAIAKGAIVAGKPADSELVQRIRADDPDQLMPPPKSKKTLSAAEKDVLERWIAQGAEYGLHWAFVRPVCPTPPAVKERGWVKSDIDAFILARLEDAGIAPSPPADRATLIRRLSLDLRGLPPTIAEVDAFLIDGSDDAYAKVVDHMLASPQYGEKMAQVWLDLARFGDTSGYNQDSTPQMWLWRDGVIDAFNRNQSFDRFTIEQLAGDLLPGATVQQRIASGFNRNTRFNEEDGADPEEFFCRSDADRTNTLGQVWLGLTLGCCECHDHKYDPVSQKEYYQLVAFFSGIKEPKAGFLHNKPLPPILQIATRAQEVELKQCRAERDEIEAFIAFELKRIGANYADTFEGKPQAAAAAPEEFRRSQLAWELLIEGNTTVPIDLRIALLVDHDKRGEVDRKTVRDYYLRHIYAGSRDVIGDAEADLAKVEKRLHAIEAAIPHTLVSEELAAPRPTFVLKRGMFDDKGERVGRAVPGILPPLPANVPLNRLGLARWLVRPDHPLTARVTVNRLWAQLFGTGLVRTLGDFGSQGDYPSHPELLDWLATDFIRTGWDLKALLKTIVLSNTYQQSSVFRMEKSDPDNRLLYRAPRFRLSAEEVRDTALAVSGLLVDKIGGPPVMPYQPAGFYTGKYEGWTWETSPREQQYRRGLYAFWRRSALHPMFTLFDAPTREECTVWRPRTNTPLQALVTLNDPTFVEAARVFAEHLLDRGPADLDGRLTVAFRTVLARHPEVEELRMLRVRYAQQLKHFQDERKAAAQLISVGQAPRPVHLDVAEHAAWTAVASMLLNLDETIMRE